MVVTYNKKYNLLIMNGFKYNSEISVSKYRTPLMGIAMLWIMLFHTYIDFPIVGSLTKMGYLGVDIFIFLSAYGLYYGYKKDNCNKKKYYIKRFLRILPSYYFVMVVFFVIPSVLGRNHDFNIKILFQQMTTLGFFIPDLKWSYFLWYIPGIMFLYLIFPLLFNGLEYFMKIKYLVLSFIVVFVLNGILTMHVLLNDYNKAAVLLLIPRIFVFLLGLVWARIEKERMGYIFSHKIFMICLMLVIFIFMVIAKRYMPYMYLLLFMLEFTPFILAMPGFFIIFAYIYDRLNGVLRKVLAFAGVYSLELYLLHETFYGYSKRIATMFDLDPNMTLTFMFLMSFLFAYLLKKFMNMLMPVMGLTIKKRS